MANEELKRLNDAPINLGEGEIVFTIEGKTFTVRLLTGRVDFEENRGLLRLFDHPSRLVTMPTDITAQELLNAVGVLVETAFRK